MQNVIGDGHHTDSRVRKSILRLICARRKKDNPRCVPAARRACEMTSDAMVLDPAPAGAAAVADAPPHADKSAPAPPARPVCAVLLQSAFPDTVGMRYILGRVRAMCRHTPAEIDAIAQELLQVRLCFHIARQSWLQPVLPIFIGFHGFATDFERSVFLRVLKHATKPRVLHSTFQASGAFEGFAVLHPTTGTADVAMLEALFELFKMSAGITDLGQYMSAPMVACIERVEAGARPYGNFRSLRAGNVRVAYLQAKQRRDTAIQLDRVRTETGLSYSTSNMLSIHYQLTNTQIELGQSFALLYRLRLLLGSLPLALDDPTAAATHIAAGPAVLLLDPGGSVQTQYVANLRSLIDSFVNTNSRPAPRGDSPPDDVVDLT